MQKFSLYIYNKYIYDLQTHFIDNILKRARAFFCSQLNGFKNWYLTIFTQPLRSDRIWHKSIFKRSLTGLNSEFSFSKTSCLTKAEDPSLPYYLPIAGGRIIGFISFPRVLVLCEMQSVSSRVWTRVAVSISYDDNYYTTGTSWIDIWQSQFNIVCLQTYFVLFDP